VADGSPYLWELARADPARLLLLFESEPESRLVALMAETSAAVAATDDEAAAMQLLRRMKAEAALLIALADIAGAWPVMRVTAALTRLADAAIAAAVRFLLNGAVQRGVPSPPDPQQPESGSGLIVLALDTTCPFELK